MPCVSFLITNILNLQRSPKPEREPHAAVQARGVPLPSPSRQAAHAPPPRALPARARRALPARLAAARAARQRERQQRHRRRFQDYYER